MRRPALSLRPEFLSRRTAFVVANGLACVLPANGGWIEDRFLERADEATSRSALVETGVERDHLSGEWGGWRTRWRQHGYHFQGGYVNEVMGVASGGLKRGAVYQGLAELAIEVDLHRATGAWRGGSARVSALFPHGSGPSGQLIGDLQTASNIDGYDSVALYELWFQQAFWDERFSLRAGQLLAESEFTATEMGGTLLNGSFGWPAFISGNTRNTGPAFFRAAPGIRARFQSSPSTYLQAGVFDGDTFDDPAGRARRNAHGVNFRLSGAQGLLAIVEAGWNRTDDDAEGHVAPLTGHFRLGAWRHSGEFEDQRQAGASHHSNFGVYLTGEHWIWREPSDSKETPQGLGAFARCGVSPDDRNLFAWSMDGGLHYRGLWPGRDEDTLALGVAAVQLSEDRRRAERAAAQRPLSDYELVVELSYQVKVWPWLSVQPDLQWIRHPGGSPAIDDAMVLGFRSRITF